MTMLMAVALTQAVGAIEIEVTNVRNDRGHVHVDICPEDRFLDENCPYSGEAPARTGTVTVIVRGVPAGEFAAQVFHDENDNGEVDRALFGIPKEGVGFSRDARIAFGPPKWRDAMFRHEARWERIHSSLRYFMGRKGPAAKRP
jgi:uncharacterized protein (DUF2141 family)